MKKILLMTLLLCMLISCYHRYSGDMTMPYMRTSELELSFSRQSLNATKINDCSIFFKEEMEKPAIPELFMYIQPEKVSGKHLFADTNAVHLVLSDTNMDADLSEIIPLIEKKLQQRFDDSKLVFHRIHVIDYHSNGQILEKLISNEEIFSKVDLLAFCLEPNSLYVRELLRKKAVENTLFLKNVIAVYENASGKRNSLSPLSCGYADFRWKKEGSVYSVYAPKNVAQTDFLACVSKLYSYKKIDPAATWFLNKSRAFVKEEQDSKSPIVFLGDSLTEKFPFDKLLSEYDIVNRGISGDKIGGYHYYGLLDRLDATVVDLNPDKIFLLIGINDIAYWDTPFEKQVQYYELLMQRLKKTDAKIYIQSMPPVSGNVFGKYLPEVKRLNVEIQHLAKQYGFVYLDLYSIFLDEQGTPRNELTLEGLHLNEEGYQLWADFVRPYLDK